jgi:hypothetical protein
VKKSWRNHFDIAVANPSPAVVDDDRPIPRAGEVAFFRSFRMVKAYEGLANERFFGSERDPGVMGFAHLARSTSAHYDAGIENAALDLGTSETPITDEEVRAGNDIYTPVPIDLDTCEVASKELEWNTPSDGAGADSVHAAMKTMGWT